MSTSHFSKFGTIVLALLRISKFGYGVVAFIENISSLSGDQRAGPRWTSTSSFSFGFGFLLVVFFFGFFGGGREVAVDDVVESTEKHCAFCTASMAVATLKSFVSRTKRLVVLTGAGISTESGIPDYRSPGRAKYVPLQHDQFMKSAEVQALFLHFPTSPSGSKALLVS